MKKGLVSFVVAGMLSLAVPTSADILDWSNKSVNGYQNGIGGGTARIYQSFRGEDGIDSGDISMDNSINPNKQFFVTYDKVDGQKLTTDRRYYDSIGKTYTSTLSFENQLDSAVNDVENNVSFLDLYIGGIAGVTGYNYEVFLKPEYTKNLGGSTITGSSDDNGYILFDSGSVVEGMSSANWETSLPGSFDHANGDDYGYVKWTALGENGTMTDYDGDGIPNTWEEQYSESTTGLNPNDDLDHDGYSNLEEYVADTNPTSDSDHFKLKMNGSSLSFDTSSNCVYTVKSSTDLTKDDWKTVADIYGNGGKVDFSIDTGSNSKFYKADVRRK